MNQVNALLPEEARVHITFNELEAMFDSPGLTTKITKEERYRMCYYT